MKNFKRIALFLALFVVLVSNAHAQRALTVKEFTPTGAVPNVKQIHAKFTMPLIKTGEATTTTLVPFTTSCPGTGKGRWLNPTEWVYEFDQELPSKTQCAFHPNSKLFPGLAAYPILVKSASISSIVPYGSSKKNIRNQHYQWIDPEQVFVILFDGKITAEEVTKRLSIKNQSNSEKIKIEVLSSAELKKLLPKMNHYYQPGSTLAIRSKIRFPEKAIVSILDNEASGDEEHYYRVQEEFHATLSCLRDKPDAPCSPLGNIDLVFNSKVPTDELKKIKLIGPNGKEVPSKLDQLKKEDDQDNVLEMLTFAFPFQSRGTYKMVVPASLKDDQGRKLSNQKSFPLTFKTDRLPALAKFPTHFGVLEASSPYLPVTVRNIESTLSLKEVKILDYKTANQAKKVQEWITKINQQDYGYDSSGEVKRYRSYLKSESGVQTLKLPELKDLEAAEVVGIPLTQKGFHVVELQSKILGETLVGEGETASFTTAVLVTNLAIHLKWANQAPTLAWVTDLTSGKPVAGAKVIFSTEKGVSFAQGITQADGTLLIHKLAIPKDLVSGDHRYSPANFMVTAEKDDDFTFTLSTWNQGIEPWRYNLGNGSNASVSMHTVMSRNLLHVGETIHFKHYVRDLSWTGFVLPTGKQMPSSISLIHDGSGQKIKLTGKFDDLGIATSEWKIPETAKLGSYSVQVGDQITGRFNIEEFRLPLMTVDVQLPKKISALDSKLNASIQGTYMSGGAAGGLPIKLKVEMNQTSTYFEEDHFSFKQDEEIKTGISNGDDRDQKIWDQIFKKNDQKDGVLYAEPDSREDYQTEEDLQKKAKTDIQEFKLNASGSALAPISVSSIDREHDYSIRVTAEYSDPSGEIKTSGTSSTYYSRNRYIGIQDPDTNRFDEGTSPKFNLAIYNLDHRPEKDASLKVKAFRHKTYTHRNRLVGGFYSYQSVNEVIDAGTLCEGKTDASGIFKCEGKTLAPGTYSLQAESKDSNGRKMVLTYTFYVYGKDSYLQEYADHDRMELSPSKKDWDTGETARVTVISPFKKFTALVTVEREGVLSHQMVELSGDKPFVEIPIKPEYSPNVFVSVLAIRGRVADPAPTGMVDLGKPAYKLGMIELGVGKKAHALKVTVTTPKKTYQVKEQVEADIQVTAEETHFSSNRSEVAVAVVDKALLQMRANPSVDLLKQILHSKSLDVITATMQMNVVGKRHFGKKANPAGGGGGKLNSRELFDSLVTWMPRVKLDAQGKAKVKFKLNDSITSFEVIAIASSGLNQFGTGQTEIASTQDLQIISSVPPTLRELDQLPLQFVLRNTTLNAIHGTAKLEVNGAALPDQSFEITGQGSKEIAWYYTVPLNAQKLDLKVTAKSNEGPADQILLKNKVVTAYPTYTVDGRLDQIPADGLKVDLTFPKDARTDKGGFRIQLQSSLATLPGSVADYMKNYEYNCFEQQSSVAVATRNTQAWAKLMKQLPSYTDSKGLIKFWPMMREGSVDLTRYVVTLSYFASQINPSFKIPKESLDALLASLMKAVEGKEVPSHSWIPQSVIVAEKIAAAEAVSHYLPVGPKTYELLKSSYKMENLSHNLMLLSLIRQPIADLKSFKNDENQYIQGILNHYDQQNTLLRLKNARFYSFALLTDTPDTQKVMTLFHFIEMGKKDEAVKLVRQIQESLTLGKLDTTPANALVSVALPLFQKKFESGAVTGKTQVSWSTQSKSLEWKKNSNPETFLPIAGSKDKSGQLKLSHSGTGQPWAFTRVEASVPRTTTLDNGIKMKKEISFVERKTKNAISRGDIIEVKIQLESNAPQGWVALVDPIPSGSTILNVTSEGGASMAYSEKRMDRLQSFLEYLPQGKSTVIYQYRLNQVGRFEQPVTRAEAMYDPTIFSESPNSVTQVVQ